MGCFKKSTTLHYCTSFSESLISSLAVCCLYFALGFQHYSLDPKNATRDCGEEGDVSELTQGKEVLLVRD